MSDLEKAAAAAVASWEREGENYATLYQRMDALREALAAHKEQAEPVAEPVAVQAEQASLRDLLIAAAAMAVVAVRQGAYEGAAWVADAVLEDYSEEQAEPVFEIGFGWLVDGRKYPRGTKLYAAPPHQQQAEPVQAEPVVERKPLTKSELLDLLLAIDPESVKRLPYGFYLFARAIEKAHGIGEKE